MLSGNAHGSVRDWLVDTEMLRLTYTRAGLSVQTKRPGEDGVRTTPLQRLPLVEQRFCWRYAFDPAGWRSIVSAG
jgi:hypothetical protein